jgi:hypothetical protein
MPRDFAYEPVELRRSPIVGRAPRALAFDPTAGRAAACLNWCDAILPERSAADDPISVVPRGSAGLLPDSDDLLGWSTLLLTGLPLILIAIFMLCCLVA